MKSRIVLYTCIFITTLFFAASYLYKYHFKNFKNETDWDFMLFTQQWPISSCTIYQEQKSNKSCNFSFNKYAWSIHGIWPTKVGTEGPAFCEKVTFNETAVKLILNDLKKHWLSISPHENLKFWKHEWLKHGACAIEIPELDSELKYFKKGLEWNQKYDLHSILSKSGIVPHDNASYPLNNIHACFKENIGSIPQIICEYDHIRKQYILTEIRLCFAKDLTLINCDVMFTSTDDTCSVPDVYYPYTVPTV